ncbi:MAG: universal stress protein [Chloroflexota bacterium]
MTGEPASIRTIVVPLDGSEKAERVVPAAIEESRLHGAPLVLLRVVPYADPPPGLRSHGPETTCSASPPEEIIDDCGLAEGYLRDVIARHAIAGGEIVVRYGDPFTQIAAELGRWPGPLVVLASYATAVLPVGSHSEIARRIAGLDAFHVLLVPSAPGT